MAAGPSGAVSPPRSTWVPRGDYVASNTDECTATLMFAVSLKQAGTVTFEYLYPDSSIVFEFFVQNDQCQPTVEESRWMRTTEKGWEFHSVELSRGNNVLYWRTTAFSVWSKAPKPVLVRNIGITGVAFTSECFPCKPGTFAPAPGAASCQPCPANTFSGKGATACQPCEPDSYAAYEKTNDNPASRPCYPSTISSTTLSSNDCTRVTYTCSIQQDCTAIGSTV
ncbi:UPF0577 protein KIAA1324-like [Neopelma chrysocephalum]|uniref:UPF0577 protein KIAA1324-like n=1 Tax=Neopelma chrysocephalum TaxID=114329 RepID=UPI000FCD0437|nr:UPF0577 protein KIAA1324-like [Neopelma chrysocephalum]